MYRVLAEFLGTFLLVAVVSYTSNPYLIGGALATGVLLAGPVSGGHLNPAVSVWAFLSGKIPSGTFLKYITAQGLAGTSVFILQKLL